MSDIAKLIEILMDDDDIRGETYIKLRKIKEEIEARAASMSNDLPPIRGAQYTMVEVSWQEFLGAYRDDKSVGIPRYFCVDVDGNILVWPKPNGSIRFMITARVE